MSLDADAAVVVAAVSPTRKINENFHLWVSKRQRSYGKV